MSRCSNVLPWLYLLTLYYTSEQQYDIISNINVNDGIINGAECCIKYIETKEDENKKVIPTIIWVQFENENLVKITDKRIHTYIKTNK